MGLFDADALFAFLISSRFETVLVDDDTMIASLPGLPFDDHILFVR